MAGITAFTFLICAVVTVVVFASLGLSDKSSPGDNTPLTPLMIGIGGSIFTVVFYLMLAALFVLPVAIAARKMLKHRPGARGWGICASIITLPVFPIGTVLGVIALLHFFGDNGKAFYASSR